MNRPTIQVSEKLFSRLQAESDRTGDPIEIVAEQAILRVLSMRRGHAGPVLFCAGCCTVQPHTFLKSQRVATGYEQLYGCATCTRPRRWGLLGFGQSQGD